MAQIGNAVALVRRPVFPLLRPCSTFVYSLRSLAFHFEATLWIFGLNPISRLLYYRFLPNDTHMFIYITSLENICFWNPSPEGSFFLFSLHNKIKPFLRLADRPWAGLEAFETIWNIWLVLLLYDCIYCTYQHTFSFAWMGKCVQTFGCGWKATSCTLRALI